MKFKFAIIAALAAALVNAQETCSCKAMPTFTAKASDGKTYTKEVLTAKPTVLVFIKPGCPHNPQGMKDFNRLHKALGDKVQFVGIATGDATKVGQLVKQFSVSFPVIADADKSITQAFNANHSLDFGLICAKDKRLAKLWDGYSAAFFKEMTASLPEHGGPKVKLDLASYPAQRKSGCSL